MNSLETLNQRTRGAYLAAFAVAGLAMALYLDADERLLDLKAELAADREAQRYARMTEKTTHLDLAEEVAELRGRVVDLELEGTSGNVGQSDNAAQAIQPAVGTPSVTRITCGKYQRIKVTLDDALGFRCGTVHPGRRAERLVRSPVYSAGLFCSGSSK